MPHADGPQRSVLLGFRICLPRDLSVALTASGPRLRQAFVPELQTLRKEKEAPFVLPRRNLATGVQRLPAAAGANQLEIRANFTIAASDFESETVRLDWRCWRAVRMQARGPSKCTRLMLLRPASLCSATERRRWTQAWRCISWPRHRSSRYIQYLCLSFYLSTRLNVSSSSLLRSPSACFFSSQQACGGGQVGQHARLGSQGLLVCGSL